MKESDVEKYLVSRCADRKWYCPKLVSQSGRGWPDRTVIKPNGDIFLVEVKMEGGKLSPAQTKMIDGLRERKLRVWVAYGDEGVDEIMDILEPDL